MKREKKGKKSGREKKKIMTKIKTTLENYEKKEKKKIGQKGNKKLRVKYILFGKMDGRVTAGWKEVNRRKKR